MHEGSEGGGGMVKFILSLLITQEKWHVGHKCKSVHAIMFHLVVNN